MTQSPSAREAYLEHPLRARAAHVMTRGNTRSTLFVPPAPPYALAGAGCVVTDQLGHEVIDCNNNYTSLIHGHALPEVTRAITSILDKGTAFGLPTETEIGLAELLAARTGHSTWRFSNSGTEAVMTAVRAARAFTGRDKIIRFAGSYHGTADAVVDLNAPGIPAGVRADVVEVPQGDRAAFDRAIAEHGTQLAAVLIDLMPNRAGLVPADPVFVDHIREATRRVDALMIVDEVITLRLAPEGLAGRYGVEPDLISVGKIIGGGYPVGGVGGRADVLAVFDPLASGAIGWGGTFSANPISMTAGRITMELFDADATSRLNARGDSLRESFKAAGVPASGTGSLIRLREQRDPGELWWAAYERGVMLGTNGLLALSTAMSYADLEAIEHGCIGAVRALREGN
jgi:glutamate-1-semialdehyde 2,1-aminomutase